MANAKVNSHPSFNYTLVEKLDSNKQLTSNDSGKLFLIDKTEGLGAFLINLPKLSLDIAGWHCKFIVSVAGTGDVSIMGFDLPVGGGSTGDSNKLIYFEEALEDTDVNRGPDKDGLKFVGSAAVPGDKIEIFCDGTQWFAYSYIEDVNHVDGVAS
tara:strand:+ start:477 stop:941 length:465 start_codon:yes stop_codon:yes gene_type:complete